jgi:NAD(P)-dependent dehydrogenase (short-subunit alcohol dehydrogenase family)
MQVNLLGHALLVRELLPSLQRSTYARIVVHTSSARQNAAQSSLSDLRGAGFSDSPSSQYALSKAALCLYARALNTRLASAGVTGAALVADPGLAATGIPYQQELVHTLGLSRRGIKSMRAYMDGYAVHAADGALPMTMAALEGEADEMWLSEPPGPRLTSLDAAAHRAGHLLWQPLRPYDPMLWPAEVAERLWTRVELLASINSTWPKATAKAAARGGGGKHDEL